MHPAPIFRWDDQSGMLSFVAERVFGTFVASIDGRLTVAQVPVLVETEQRLVLHLSHANPIAKALPLDAVLVVSGPDAYVSPDWYREPDQVPTMSYVSVELDGRLEATDDAMLLEILDRTAAELERRIPDKRPWTTSKMTPSVLAAKLKGIVGATFSITAVRGTSKLSQNKSEADRNDVIDALTRSARDGDRQIAALMRSKKT